MMKRIVCILACFLLLCACTGCLKPQTGGFVYEGTYVKAANGQHILIHSSDDGTEFFLLQAAENCKSLDKLKTGDKIKITVGCLAYEEAEFSERHVYDWSKSLFGRTDVPQATLEQIETLLAQYNSQGSPG